MKKFWRKEIEIPQRIDLEKITPLNPFSEMSKGGRMAVEGILEMIEKNYGKKIKKEPYVYVAKMPFDQMEVLNYLKMYFVNFSDIDFLFLSSGMEILVDMKTGKRLEEKRKKIMREIEGTISSFYEGEEEWLVEQVTMYLLKEIKKNKKDIYLYPLMFRLMLFRLGISCDVCIGFTIKRKYHIWNIVRFSGGERRYYDLAMEANSVFKSYLGTTKFSHKAVGINYFPTEEDMKSFLERNF